MKRLFAAENVLTMAVGAGAILQVLGVLYRVVGRETGNVWSPLNAIGVAAGLVLMYGMVRL